MMGGGRRWSGGLVMSCGLTLSCQSCQSPGRDLRRAALWPILPAVSRLNQHLLSGLYHPCRRVVPGVRFLVGRFNEVYKVILGYGSLLY